MADPITAHGWTAESNNQLTWRGPTGSRTFRAVSDPADRAIAACIRDAATLAEARRLATEALDGEDLVDFPEGIANLLDLLTRKDQP